MPSSKFNKVKHEPTYNPHPLLDALITRLMAKNDAGLARALGLTPPAISKIRHKKVVVSAETLICMHDATGMPINDLRKLMGAPIVERKPEAANA